MTKQDLEKRFMKLASDLSPENLYCDGELSHTEAQRKAAHIRREWRALEAEYGREVSEEEVENWMIGIGR